MKTLPDPAVNHNAESSVRVPSTVRSPESSQGSDPEFPVDLILAPEPSLTEGLSRPKTRSGASNPGGSSEGNPLLTITAQLAVGASCSHVYRVGSLSMFWLSSTRLRKPAASVKRLVLHFHVDKVETASNPPEVKEKSTARTSLLQRIQSPRSWFDLIPEASNPLPLTSYSTR